MAGRIVTVRHGKPAQSRDMRFPWRDYAAWWAQYERSGLRAGERAPEPLVELAQSSDVVLSSTRPRAIETARSLIGLKRDIPTIEDFVEAPLPAPPLPFVRLRPGAWGVISRTYWFLGYAPEAESHAAAWRRVFAAADDLFAKAEKGDVLLCAHGYFNWMLDKAMRWKGARRRYDGGSSYWAWRVYEKPLSAAAPASSGRQIMDRAAE